jgi:hypothetical protein
MSLLQVYCLSPQVDDPTLDCIRLGDIRRAKKSIRDCSRMLRDYLTAYSISCARRETVNRARYLPGESQ